MVCILSSDIPKEGMKIMVTFQFRGNKLCKRCDRAPRGGNISTFGYKNKKQ